MKPIRHTATLLTLALLAALTLLTPPRAHAQINYQGRLTDAAGATLPDGTYTITFSLWDSATAGTQLWGPFIADGTVGTGRGPLVDVVGGLNPNGGRFNVIIGATDTASRSLTTAMAAAASPFLQIQVAPNAAISPRQQIFATPRALRADVIPNVTPNGSNTIISGNVGIGAPSTGAPLAITTTNDGYSVFNPANTNGCNLSLVGGAGFFSTEASINDIVLRAIGGGKLLLQTGAGASGICIASNNNVGIGTPGPNAKLDVRGDIKLGPSGQYFAASGEENLRIVRGTVSATGTMLAGAGFTSARTPGGGSGDYTITFSTGFSAAPAVTGASMTGQGVFTINQPTGVTTTTVRVLMYETSAFNNPVDYTFNFIAVGPR